MPNYVQNVAVWLCVRANLFTAVNIGYVHHYTILVCPRNSVALVIRQGSMFLSRFVTFLSFVCLIVEGNKRFDVNLFKW